MKDFNEMNSKYILILGCVIASTTVASGQLIRKVPGYASVIEKRFDSSFNWKDSYPYELNKLLNISVSKSNRWNFLVPVIDIEGSDSIVSLYSVTELRRSKKTVPFFKTKMTEIKASPFFSFNKGELIERTINWDSIGNHMRNNIRINSATFDTDTALTNDISTECCRFSNYRERMETIYLFFINGILLSEDPHTGTLYYLSY